jgi:hypothetical protein
MWKMMSTTRIRKYLNTSGFFVVAVYSIGVLVVLICLIGVIYFGSFDLVHTDYGSD